MADTPTPPPEDETPNQRQARLRREKRQKKMAEQGEDRLAKIKALNGGVAPPDEVLGGPVSSQPASSGAKQQPLPRAAAVSDEHDDPEEVDIDTVSGSGTPSAAWAGQRGAGDNPLAAAMMQMQQQQGRLGGGQGGAGGEAEDPMVQMMQQLTGLLGGNSQNPNDPNQQPELPPMLQALMGGGGGMGGQTQKAPDKSSAYVWRIVHAVFALSLGLYVTVRSTFNGSKLARSQAAYMTAEEAGLGPRLFLVFASAELILQSTRFFVEKGQLKGSGILAQVANSGFVPEPYAGYIRTVGRYLGIFQTVVADAMVIVFVFGALAWWRGMAAA